MTTIPTPGPAVKVTLDSKEREWVAHTGPWPYIAATPSQVIWSDHTAEEVIKHHTALGTAASMRIVRKLMGEIE